MGHFRMTQLFLKSPCVESPTIYNRLGTVSLCWSYIASAKEAMVIGTFIGLASIGLKTTILKSRFRQYAPRFVPNVRCSTMCPLGISFSFPRALR